MSSRRFAFALGTVALVAAAVRLWGLGFGLPYLYHGDEAEIVRLALGVPRDGLNPHWFQYPSLYVYVQAVAYVAVYGFERATGAAPSYGGFVDAAAVDPSTVYLTGRAVAAAFGTATVVLTGLAGRRMVSLGERPAAWAGLGAAALLAVDHLHVEHSHYITVDAPLAFGAACVLLAVAAIAGEPDGGTRRQYAVAGACVGMAASFKYPGALLAVAVVAVYAQRVSWRDWRARLRDVRLPVAAAASIVTFLAGSPFVLLSFEEFMRDFATEVAHMRTGHLGFETVTHPWLMLLGGVYNEGGVALLALFAVGAVVLVVRRDVFGRAAAVTAVVLFVLAGFSNVLFLRYLLPIYPIAAVVAARGAVALARGRGAVFAGVLAVSCLLPAYLTWQQLRLFDADDTRTEALEWVRENADGPVAAEWKSIPTPARDLRTVPLVYDLGALRAGGVRYVVVVDRLYRRYLKAPDRYPKQFAFYRDLVASGPPVRVFSPYPGAAGRLTAGDAGEPEVEGGAAGPLWTTLPHRTRSGPIIEVYALE